MATKGYLKMAMDKTTKKGKPFVSLLVLKNPDDEEGMWMNLFDLYYAGGTKAEPSEYDIRRYADRDDPPAVVYEADKNGDFVNCLAIRPADEEWFKAVKDAVKPKKGKRKPSADEPLSDLESLRLQAVHGMEMVFDAIVKAVASATEDAPPF